jgi:ABC-2 type transport system ATP-binding protein
LPGELRLDENASVKSILNYLRRLRQGGKDCSAKISQLASRLDLNLDSKIKNLSKGNKQKLGIIAAFMHKPKLLLLDEPTSGLDPLVQQIVLELVKEAKQSGATIFFSSHVLAEVQSVADRVAIIKNGEIVEVGVTSSLLSKRAWRAKIKFVSDDSGRGAMIKDLEGVTVLEVSDDYKIFDIGIEGNVDPFIKFIANFEVDYLEINKPNLEEIFLSYYGD